MPTAIQPTIIEGPGGGLITHVDPRHVPDKAWSNGRNVRFPASGTRVRKTDGYKQLDFVPDSEPIRALWDYVSTDSPSHRLVAITLTGAWHGLGFDRENFNSPDPPPATLANVVTMDQFKEKLIWADGLRVLQWDGFDRASPLGPQTNPDPALRAPVGKLVEIHKDRVLLANITLPQIQPWRLHWSAPDLPNKWFIEFEGDSDGALAGFIDFLDDSSEIVAIKTLGDHVIVHKTNRIYRLVNVGEPDIYVFENIPADDGSISARSPVSIGSWQYFMGHRNFYRLAAYNEPIGDAIWPEIEPTLDWTRHEQVYAYRRQEFDEVCWKIPQIGGAPDLSAVYNFRAQAWTLTNHDSGTCFSEVNTSELPPDSLLTNPPPVRGVFGQANGRIQVYGGPDADGTRVQAWVESKHFQTGLLPSKIVAVPVFATGTGTLRVQLRAAMEARAPMPPWPATPHPSTRYPLAASQTRPWIDVRAYGRLSQIRIESDALGDDWEVSAYGMAIIPGAYAR